MECSGDPPLERKQCIMGYVVNMGFNVDGKFTKTKLQKNKNSVFEAPPHLPLY